MKEGIDLTGQRFGRLTVDLIYEIKKVERRSPRYYYWCSCDCGSSKAVSNSNLTSGRIRSCGCLSQEQKRTGNSSRRHGCTNGRAQTPEYRAWASAKKRCSNPKDRAYQNYGGRGIKFCNRWLKLFENFYADMGDRPSPKHSLDRIDVNGHYSPENCRWASRQEQANNTRSNKYLTIGESTFTVADWARKMGVDSARIYDRLKLGWTEADAVLTPVYKRNSRSHQSNFIVLEEEDGSKAFDLALQCQD